MQIVSLSDHFVSGKCNLHPSFKERYFMWLGGYLSGWLMSSLALQGGRLEDYIERKPLGTVPEQFDSHQQTCFLHEG
jgi:hypothetical protein